MTTTSSDLIVQSWTDLAKDFVSTWAVQGKKAAEVTDTTSGAKVLQDAGGLVISGLMKTGVTILEVLELIVEPIEQRQLTEASPHRTNVASGTAHSYVRYDMVHEDHPTEIIKAREITVQDFDMQGDAANLWLAVFTWINGRVDGRYDGKVEVLDDQGNVIDTVTTNLVV